MAAVAAAAFTASTSAARADVMPAGAWDGRITGGTLGLGDGNLRPNPVPAGDPFTFTIPAGAGAPVAFRAPAMHVPIRLKTTTDSVGTVRTVAGSLDISPLAGTIDPGTGVAHATATAHGVLHLSTFNSATPPGSSTYCHLGEQPAPASNPAPPAPFGLRLGATWSGGSATLTDTAFAVKLDCGDLIPLGTTGLPIIGSTLMRSGVNQLSLTATFTRRAGAVKCVVPKLKGLRLKQARKAAKKANCAVGRVKRKKSSRRATTVLKQGTRPGAVLARGTKIALTVAR